jgi:hypothetical protein
MLLAAEYRCYSGDLQDTGVGGRWESALRQESAHAVEVVRTCMRVKLGISMDLSVISPKFEIC